MPIAAMDLRRAGVVLHPTSLPGAHGCGDFGANAYYFVDWLYSAGQTLWQTLPLGPVGPGFSPYMSESAFAGNPLLVALEPLVERGWLAAASLQDADFDPLHVDYARVMPWRMARLRQAYAGFVAQASQSERDDQAQWLAVQQPWLDDYALFMALEQNYAPVSWPAWPQALARREPQALAAARQQFADEIAFWCFVQWQFDCQWQLLKNYAHSKGVLIVGDMPIFVGHHSADCWARPDLYLLDADGAPSVVAGVPPDFFSDTGQFWGNPLYDWAAMAADDYRWWIARVKRQLDLVDVLRFDHFRGFVDYWQIPAAEPTAVNGCWQDGPADALFAALAQALGPLPVIVEDLGIITQAVIDLRQRLGFAGMRVLQFAFSGDAHHPFLPHNFDPNTVVYTGTHDTDTLLGWWATCSQRERAFVLRYLDTDEAQLSWAMLRAGLMSSARWSLCQLQDVFQLDGAHRMNLPGTTAGCWSWRFCWQWACGPATQHLAQLSAASGRCSFERLNLPF